MLHIEELEIESNDSVSFLMHFYIQTQNPERYFLGGLLQNLEYHSIKCGLHLVYNRAMSGTDEIYCKRDWRRHLHECSLAQETFNPYIIGNSLRNLRENRKKTQMEVAGALGICNSHYARLECSMRGMS
mgnify:CR=1 FL=1